MAWIEVNLFMDVPVRAHLPNFDRLCHLDIGTMTIEGFLHPLHHLRRMTSILEGQSLNEDICKMTILMQSQGNEIH